MKALIIGASGQAGRLLAQACRETGVEAVGTYANHAAAGLRRLDIRDGEAVREMVGGAEVVFLPAAMTHVDGAEARPDEAYDINVRGARLVAEAAREAKATLVFFSTEHVFGDSPAAHAEDEPTAPVSVYARTKTLGEAAIREVLPGRHLILRTSWVYGPDEQGKNFVCRAVRTLRQGEALVVPADQFGQPTFSVDLAATAVELVRRGIRGTFHVVGPELLTRLAFAKMIAEVFGLDAARIMGVPTSELRQAAPGPLRVELTRGKLIQVLGRDPIRRPATALGLMRDGAFGAMP